MGRTITTGLAALALVGGALAADAAMAGAKAGVSAAVRGSVALTRQAEQIVGRSLASGEEIFLRDEIASGPRSGMQILLLDETVFTIGPDSAILIDEFVYDPGTDGGRVSAEVVKGVFRFVTGKVAAREPENMNVELPVGNIGIRGTIVVGWVRPDGSCLAILLGAGPRNDLDRAPGAFVATNAGVSRWVRTPGWGAEFVPGQPPRVFRVDPRLIAEITGQLQNPQGTPPPTHESVLAGVSPGEEGGAWTAEGYAFSLRSFHALALGAGANGASFDAVQTALEEQSTLASIADLDRVGGGAAFYGGSAALDDGGSYDFNLVLDFDGRTVFADFFNIDSPSLNVMGEFSSGGAPFDAGLSGHALFEFPATPIVTSVGACQPQCGTSVKVLFENAASPPQTSDHRFRIEPPGMIGGVEGGADDVPLGDFGQGG